LTGPWSPLRGSLPTKLDATNNLVPTTDFRTLHATGLQWLGVHDTEPILGGRFDPVGVLR
jgi:hypothetical protein